MLRSPNLRAGNQQGFIWRVETDKWERARYDLLRQRAQKKRFCSKWIRLAILAPLIKGSYTAAGKTIPFTLTKGRGTEPLKCRFKFNKCGQLFIDIHNETLSVAASLRAAMTSLDTFAKCVRAKITTVGCPKRRSRSHDVVNRAMRVAMRLETQEHRDEFNEL